MAVTKRNSSELVRMHLNEVKRYPLLSEAEEFDLAEKAKKGDKIAKDKLLTSNMRFVIKVAAQYRNRGLDFEDLISEGYLGLIRAVEHFDAKKGYHFISYAVWWIRQGILKAISEFANPIRLPVNKVASVYEIKKVQSQINLDGTKTEEQELEEIADYLGMTKYHVREMLNLSRDMISLDSPVAVDADTSLADTIVATEYKSPEEFIVEQSMNADINKVLGTLDEKSAQIISLRYGLNGLGEGGTLKEVGEKMNLSRERVRQIEKNALAKLKEEKRSSLLKDYVA